MRGALLDDVEFKAGLRLGGLGGGLLVAALYTVGATTHDIRARIPFLFSGFSSLILMVAGTLFLAGLVALWSVRGLSLRGGGGVAVSTVALTLLIVLNAPARIIPDLQNPRHGIAVLTAVAALVLGLGWWERVKAHRERRKDIGRTGVSAGS